MGRGGAGKRKRAKQRSTKWHSLTQQTELHDDTRHGTADGQTDGDDGRSAVSAGAGTLLFAGFPFGFGFGLPLHGARLPKKQIKKSQSLVVGSDAIASNESTRVFTATGASFLMNISWSGG